MKKVLFLLGVVLILIWLLGVSFLPFQIPFLLLDGLLPGNLVLWGIGLILFSFGLKGG